MGHTKSGSPFLLVIVTLHQWTHYVVKHTSDPANPVQLWVNGNPVALQYKVNDLDSAARLAGSGSLMVGSHKAELLENQRLLTKNEAEAELTKKRKNRRKQKNKKKRLHQKHLLK